MFKKIAKLSTAMRLVVKIAPLILLFISGAGNAQSFQATWMSPEVAQAWNMGYKGNGATITVVDDFSSNKGLLGSLRGGLKFQRHGAWVTEHANLIAPGAFIRTSDYGSNGNPISLASKGLNVINMSFGLENSASEISLSDFKGASSAITYAQNGTAVVIKAAGNSGQLVSVTGVYLNSYGNQVYDHLNLQLVGAKSVIFAGALNKNGSASSPASMATYSTIAGADVNVQKSYLVVGVVGGSNQTYALHGTSFAAPIISGYAAILGSKFTSANSTQVVNQLLTTARKDTISNYSQAVHGMGEASIKNALAPLKIQ